MQLDTAPARDASSRHPRAVMTPRRIAALSAALGVFVLAFASAAEARRFACDGGDVACLIAAIEAANADGSDDTILLSAGVYTLSSPAFDQPGTERLGLPPITGKLTIAGESAGLTVIERVVGAQDFRILTVLGNLTLRGVTLRNGGGASAIEGGAILVRGRLSMSDSIINSSRAREGGALKILGAAKIADSTISGNTALEGAGIFVVGSPARLDITDSTISGNSGTFGGALNVQFGGTATIVNTTIARNSAVTGSAINLGPPADAFIPPGTILPLSTATVTNSTIVENAIGNPIFQGAVLFNRGGITGVPSGDIRVKDTIIARNSGTQGDCPASAISLGFNLIGDAANCPAFLVSTDITGDPGLGPFIDDGAPGRGYFPLLPGSPAIDAGGIAPRHRRDRAHDHEKAHEQETECPATDQIGQPRVGRCDIGAIEFLPDRVTIRQARFDAQTGVLFVSGTSSLASEGVSLFASVEGCLADVPMLRLGGVYLLLTVTDCGDLHRQTVAVDSSGGGSATARIR